MLSVFIHENWNKVGDFAIKYNEVFNLKKLNYFERFFCVIFVIYLSYKSIKVYVNVVPTVYLFYERFI